MKRKSIIASLVLSCSIVLSGCSSKDLPPGDYDASEVGKIKKVVPGVIISKRPVNIHSKNTDTVAPGADNNTPPADTTDNTGGRSHGFEYVIRLNSGAIISVVQTEDVQLKTKQHILVIYGSNTRVVPDEGNDNY